MWAWTSFIGLVLDFIGVFILTLDVLPEFKLNRRRRRLRQLARNTEHLVTGDLDDTASDDPIRAVAGKAVALVSASHALAGPARLPVSVARAALENCATDFGCYDDPIVRVALADGAFDRSLFDAAMSFLNDRAGAAGAEFDDRWRPNLFFGVTLVLVGFAVQAFAAMPTDAQRWTVEMLLSMIGKPPEEI